MTFWRNSLHLHSFGLTRAGNRVETREVVLLSLFHVVVSERGFPACSVTEFRRGGAKPENDAFAQVRDQRCAGIGINSSSTGGLYPRSESPGLAAITGTLGAIKPDTKQAEQCKTVSTTAAQDKKMADFIARTTANPGTYRLGGNNCTNFVRSVLEQAGVSTPMSPGPRPYFEALPGRP